MAPSSVPIPLVSLPEQGPCPTRVRVPLRGRGALCPMYTHSSPSGHKGRPVAVPYTSPQPHVFIVCRQGRQAPPTPPPTLNFLSLFSWSCHIISDMHSFSFLILTITNLFLLLSISFCALYMSHQRRGIRK